MDLALTPTLTPSLTLTPNQVCDEWISTLQTTLSILYTKSPLFSQEQTLALTLPSRHELFQPHPPAPPPPAPALDPISLARAYRYRRHHVRIDAHRPSFVPVPTDQAQR